MEYGKNDKRISFMDTDKRAAELLIRLKHDGLTKTRFFREILTGYLERDSDMVSFVDKVKSQSKTKSTKTKNMEQKGNENKNKFGLNQGEIENIFDMLEKEHPDL
tara:strand:+ start:80 stop:394 length:315 start_codon:yes stop_codon:yes gene_type:complete